MGLLIMTKTTKQIIIIITAVIVSSICIFLLFFFVCGDYKSVYSPEGTKIVSISNSKNDSFCIGVEQSQVKNIGIKVYASDGRLMKMPRGYLSDSHGEPENYGPGGYLRCYSLHWRHNEGVSDQ